MSRHECEHIQACFLFSFLARDQGGVPHLSHVYFKAEIKWNVESVQQMHAVAIGSPHPPPTLPALQFSNLSLSHCLLAWLSVIDEAFLLNVHL